MLSFRARWLVCLALCVAVLSFGQGKKRTDDREEHDQPREREQWFRRGRPSDGGTAAQKLHKAYQQKMTMRAAQRARVATGKTSASAGSSSATPVPNASQPTPSAAQIPANGATWVALGPAPAASDASGAGSQDYGPVTGRATAVAIDQNDRTGNTVYLGGAYGGLWKSTNAADTTVSTCANSTARCAPNVSWTALIDDQATLAVGAIAVQPGNSNVVLVGTGESNLSADSYYGLGILRSTQAGASGSWSLITSANSGARPFRGLAFSRISFSTDNPNLVVAATASASAGITAGAELPTTTRGLYYSIDAGANWSSASVLDAPGSAPSAGSTHSVVYHPTEHKFYAALRAHGIYSSSDGVNWTRLSAQPGPITLTNCPTSPTDLNCPLYRSEMAIVPGRDEMYVWLVDSKDNNQGMYQTRDGGATWTQVPSDGIVAVGSKLDQGTYNLDLAAIPNGSGTDLHAGAVDQFKCTISSPANPGTCGFVNLTHVYSCSPWGSFSHVHPDEHSLDFLHAGTSADYKLVYFANDGGIYRTLNSFSTVQASCSGNSQASIPFDNLNGTMGSMTQFVWFSHHPTDSATIVGGTQDNGSPATGSAGTSQTWANVNNGDGGFNEIDPSSPNIWYTSNTYVSIQRCSSGINCTSGSFPNTIGSTQVGSDSGSFYAPFMLDPQDPTRMLVGTCRVWRGNSNGSGWSSTSALSNPNFSSTLTAACPKGDVTNPPYNPDNISALAAGGPKTSNGSQVIYAGTEGGKIWVTTNADGGASTWTSRTGSTNPKNFPISSIALDLSDGAGLTAYVTIMGFDVSHVFRTTNGGQTWTDYTGDLPNAPADAVVVDRANPVTVYVGTDVGVFATTNGGVNWTEVGLTGAGVSTFPNLAVTSMKIFIGSTEHLRVSTYGRGIWDIDLGIQVHEYQLAPLPTSATVKAGAPAPYTITVTPQGGALPNAVALSCSGLPALAACNFSPASVTVGSTPATATLNITTTAATGWLRPWQTGPMYALSLPIVGVVLAGARSKRRRTFLMVLAMWCAVSLLLFLQACGGGNNNGGGGHAGTPTGTYRVTVTGTSGGMARSTTVTLTVQ